VPISQMRYSMEQTLPAQSCPMVQFTTSNELV
jgi:hypothetical protein